MLSRAAPGRKLARLGEPTGRAGRRALAAGPDGESANLNERNEGSEGPVMTRLGKRLHGDDGGVWVVELRIELDEPARSRTRRGEDGAVSPPDNIFMHPPLRELGHAHLAGAKSVQNPHIQPQCMRGH
jgi:hypothetical protein